MSGHGSAADYAALLHFVALGGRSVTLTPRPGAGPPSWAAGVTLQRPSDGSRWYVQGTGPDPDAALRDLAAEVRFVLEARP